MIFALLVGSLLVAVAPTGPDHYGVVLSDLQIARLVIKHKVGPDAGTQTTMIMVCLAESGGNRLAINPSSGARGLWQIYPPAHQDLLRRYDWKNPDDNAEMARIIFNSEGPDAWSVITNGSYEKYRERATNAYRRASGNPGPIVTNPIHGVPPVVANPLSSITDFLSILTSGAFWIRALSVVGGAVILLIGVMMAFKMQDKIPSIIPLPV